jgi:sporulation protein YlmC with PRC-barrel domain
MEKSSKGRIWRCLSCSSVITVGMPAARGEPVRSLSPTATPAPQQARADQAVPNSYERLRLTPTAAVAWQWQRGMAYWQVFKRITMTTSSETSGYVISSNKVEGTTVYNGSGDKLGSIDDLMIDKRTGHVRYAVLEFGGFLGMGTDRYPIPWDYLRYDTDKDGYVIPVDMDKQKLENAPRYREEAVPVYDNDFGRRIDSYYGPDA